MPHPLISLTIALLVLGSCSDRPDLNAAISDDARRARAPKLIDLSDLLAVDPNDFGNTDLAAQLTARVAALRARAARMQRPVVDARSRRRMAAAIARHNG